MKKVGLITISLFLLNFVSAAYGSFTNFSLDGFTNTFDTSLFLVALIFLAIFGIVYKSVEKTNLINNRAIQAIIAFGASAFAMYGILQTNINFGGLLSGFGLPEDFIRTAIPIIIVLVFIILWVKIGFGNLLMIIGSLLIAVGLLDLVYSKGLSIAVGTMLVLIGFFARKQGKIYGYGKTIGRGLGKAGAWAYRNRPSMRRFLKKENRMVKKIRKLEKKYQKALANNEPKKAKDYADQIEYLRGRLQKLKNDEQKKLQRINEEIKQGQNDSNLLRRGGETPRRGRFVSKASVERYTQMYGKDAARKRFGK